MREEWTHQPMPADPKFHEIIRTVRWPDANTSSWQKVAEGFTPELAATICETANLYANRRA